MALTKYKLGDLIELRSICNSNLQYGIDHVRGVNNLKQFMSTKADLSTRDLSKFQIVSVGDFVFNHRTSRNGSKFSIAYNDTQEPVICTEDYVVFHVKPECTSQLMAEWLYLYFNRPEFDRYVITNSWGSSTEFYNWEDICDIDIELPDITVQQKYVNIYKAIVQNQQCYERGLEDLKLVCDGYIENLRKTLAPEKIGPFIQRRNDRNKDKSNDMVMGLSTKKEFRQPQSRVNRDELGSYKIVSHNDVAYVPTTDTWKVLAFAINSFMRDIVVSPIYEVFKINTEKILPEYLAIWLKRDEFDRYARFHSWGSARETFDWSEMCDVKIPIPDIKVQQSIVNIYNAYLMRKEINEKLKAQIKDICPILIRGSLEEV